ncbi:hypothetical protein RI845_01600 [Thalassotalea nanhaiensis]|uniref:Uncharacterized protein n=1 Tax=Thalassotalea nanhaiensis TaxID=3065648 RepID=A0ABY9TJA8_9GAMM|nr:hypothetical protein RI845_01600 [Colwelliaceae bacterium SQ345]
MKKILKSKLVNGWQLFWLISLTITIAVFFVISTVDLGKADEVSSMIQFTVRCSVPLLYLSFVASSYHALFPGVFSRWLLRNRKYIGVAYSAAMAWQLVFIIWLVTIFSEHYISNVYSFNDIIIQVPGYIVLVAMTVTSFTFGRKLISPKQWQVLHKWGIYFLWATVWSTYWYELFYYVGIDQPIDYIFYWAGFIVWSLRMAAWSIKHRQQTNNLLRKTANEKH